MASEVKDKSLSTPSDDENDTSEEIKNVKDSKEEEDVKNETKKDSDDEEEDDDDDDDEEEEEEVALLDRPVEVTGCRARKKVERLDVSFALTSKVKQEIPEGRGQKLGENPKIEMQIQKMKLPDLKTLHHVCFNRMGSGNEIKKNLRKFSGFTFEKDSAEYNRKKAALEKLTFPVLKNICMVLDVKRNGTKEEVVGRILSFLWKPEYSKKKESSQKTPKEKKSSGKKVKSEKKAKHKSKDEPKEDIEDDDSSVSEASEGGSDEDVEDKPKKKSTASIKISKTEKSNEDKKHKGTKRVKDESSGSSDDEPPTKKFKMPSDEEISKLVKQILESADLQEITMKKVIKQVSDAYPEFDLSHKKAFIKSTIKSVIS